MSLKITLILLWLLCGLLAWLINIYQEKQVTVEDLVLLVVLPIFGLLSLFLLLINWCRENGDVILLDWRKNKK